MSGPINEMLADTSEPRDGDGATIFLRSYRRAATVIEIILLKSGPRKGQPRKIVVQEDDWGMIGGSTQDDSATYAFRQNPVGFTHTFTRTSKGWSVGSRGFRVTLGRREHQRDPLF